MILIALLGAMALAAALALAWPLIRRERTPETRAAFERAVFNAQLAELARDHDRGLIGDDEARAARAEIERRALNALERAGAYAPGGSTAKTEADTGTPPARHNGARALAAALIIALPAVAGVIYATLGAPGLPGHPFTGPPPGPAKVAAPSPKVLAALVVMVETRVREAPSDNRGWSLLLRLDRRTGRTGATQALYQSILSGAKDPAVRAGTAIAYGEALTAAADGTVTAAARTAFNTAYRARPTDPSARYYQGLIRLQAGDPEGALEIWTALRRDSPADAPWRARLGADIDRLIREQGLNPKATPKPGP